MCGYHFKVLLTLLMYVINAGAVYTNILIGFLIINMPKVHLCGDMFLLGLLMQMIKTFWSSRFILQRLVIISFIQNLKLSCSCVLGQSGIIKLICLLFTNEVTVWHNWTSTLTHVI